MTEKKYSFCKWSYENYEQQKTFFHSSKRDRPKDLPHLKACFYTNEPFHTIPSMSLLVVPLWRARPTQDFLRGPEERTKGTIVLSPCPGVKLARLVQHWSQGIIGVKVVVCGGLTSPGLRISVLRHPFLTWEWLQWDVTSPFPTSTWLPLWTHSLSQVLLLWWSMFRKAIFWLRV